MSQQILPIELPNGFMFEMVLVEGGTFMMGSEETSDREKPIHEVTLADFYIGKHTVTQQLWEIIMGKRKYLFGDEGDELPVVRVSWEDTKDFIKILKDITGQNFRLPSEAEWEYAARGGVHSQNYRYAGSDKLKQVGWFGGGVGPREVGLLLGNELGLHDMCGNVWEWCEDDWHNNYENAPVDGSPWVDAPKRTADRVLRGGSMSAGPLDCHPSHRSSSTARFQNPDWGFRLALSIQGVF